MENFTNCVSDVEQSNEPLNGEEEDLLDLIDFESDLVDNESDAAKLYVGMEFQTVEEVRSRYAQYAKSRGFQVRIRNSRPKIVQIVCYREGLGLLRKKEMKDLEVDERHNTKHTKVGCRACLYCCLDSSINVWRITKFNDEHNHLMVSPKSCKFLRRHKHLPTSAKCLSQIFESEGIPVGKVTNVLNLNPEEAEFTRKDCWNYMTSMRKQILEEGDAQSVHDFCIRQQRLDSNFRYSIQFDFEGRMLNWFWIDARSRAAYEIFGDVISFDTTYKTNKYSMPFAPFVGIDNHLHTILFGCALLQDETESTFNWLFNAWLEAVDGKVPSAILTDQDNAMMNAVKKVFPSAKHRLCIWHIKKKFPERLSHLYHDKSSFKGKLNYYIHESLSIDEFEDKWKKLVVEFGLEHNEWFSNLYSIREIWVPIYSKNVFFGGMNTTGRSESINAFFDYFVKSGTTLKEFVGKYVQALENRYESFRRSEFDTLHKTPRLCLDMSLEEHASNVFTAEIFKEFHSELSGILAYNRELLIDEYPKLTYRVKRRSSNGNGYVVYFDVQTQDTKCECLKFENMGVLCSHILSVFYTHNIEQIPPQFILPRWTKNVARILLDIPISYDTIRITNLDHVEMKLHFDDMCVICEKSKSVLDFVKKGIATLHAEAKVLFEKDPETVMFETTHRTSQHPSPVILDPKIVQTKGRKKVGANRSSRIRRGIEISADPTVKCSVCLKNGHNRRTCPHMRQS